MDDIPLPQGWVGDHPHPSQPRSVVELLASRTLDAELAALLWLLVEARLPLVVAGDARGVGQTTLLAALLDFLPPDTRRVPLRGLAEDFAWLPEARELGWAAGPSAAGSGPHGHPATPQGAPARPDPRSTVMLAAELSGRSPACVWGDTARVAIRAISLGYGLAAAMPAGSLEDVFSTLRRSPISLTDDELSHLGVVLVLQGGGDALADRRVAAAHYVRPLARDHHGHVQRLGPAVLATWDEHRDAFEHFAWGVTPELALRTGLRAGDFEAEQERRREYLAGLARSGIHEPDAVRTAIRGYRHTTPTTMPSLTARSS